MTEKAIEPTCEALVRSTTQGHFAPAKEIQLGHHWLLDWIDEFDIQSGQTAIERIALPGPLARLYELACNEKTAVRYTMPNKNAIIGGQGFDIGAQTGCPGFDCRSKIIDNELAQILHFFDYTIMEGPSAFECRKAIEELDSEESSLRFAMKLMSHIDTLLHARAIGLLNYTYFVRKPTGFCQDHFTIHAKEIGLDDFAERNVTKELARRIAREGSVEIKQASKEVWVYTINHPIFAGFSTPPMVSLRAKSAPPRYVAVEAILWLVSSAAVSDLATARTLGAPLVTIGPASLQSQFDKSNDSKLQEVALLLNLPFFSGLGAKDLIRLREEQSDNFTRFRASLIVAIKECIEKSGSAAPAEIAQSVRSEYIEPALADIARQDKAKSRSVLRKIASGVTIGGAITTFGAITSMPLLVAAGIAASATPLPQIYKYFEDKQAVELSDMYFLWQASRYAKH
ncbi:hypothetical protein [Kutzneria albida]|uniref:Uncharacterized protein n=1 Tax=Kutzneria albida DSM 43870 TaxID=1449976 RepID=W5W0I4_9PSEU|nr:hypothetical protein [Kutzneria albida]AHH94066.1 hypothetical protein KALB_691 [Kutzneria albida DSM 43870]